MLRTALIPATAEAGAPRRGALPRELALLAAGSLLLALSARVVIPLPAAISPVPVTAQTLAVILLAGWLGAGRAAACVSLYLAEGAAGLPVFAGGAGGPAHLLGPTGGYLAGFLAAAWIVGRLVERGWDRSLGAAATAAALGTAAILACGSVRLAAFVGPARALDAGLVPFLPGAAVKIALAAAALRAARRVTG